jgi:hypothetical protein
MNSVLRLRNIGNDIAVFLKSPFNASAYSPLRCSADNSSSKFAMVPGELAARLVL